MMNYLQAGPAETTNYMIFGMLVVFVTMGIHVWSLFSRNKRLKEDLQMIEDAKK